MVKVAAVYSSARSVPCRARAARSRLRWAMSASERAWQSRNGRRHQAVGQRDGHADIDARLRLQFVRFDNTR